MISKTESCALHKQRVYASDELGAARKMVNTVVLITDRGDEEKKIGVRKTLLLLRCVLCEVRG